MHTRVVCDGGTSVAGRFVKATALACSAFITIWKGQSARRLNRWQINRSAILHRTARVAIRVRISIHHRGIRRMKRIRSLPAGARSGQQARPERQRCWPRPEPRGRQGEPRTGPQAYSGLRNRQHRRGTRREPRQPGPLQWRSTLRRPNV
jgi:hypothetical protein